jgi:hypothetical protein
MNKYCIRCGAELALGTRFCHKCGAQIVEAATMNNTEQQFSTPQTQPAQLDSQFMEKPKGKYVDIFLSGSLESVKNSTQIVFNQNKFDVRWETSFAGKASKGSKAANVALGAAAQYYQIDFKIFTMPNKDIALRLIQAEKGAWGGLLGMSMEEKKFRKMIDAIMGNFSSMGIYKGRFPQ